MRILEQAQDVLKRKEQIEKVLVFVKKVACVSDSVDLQRFIKKETEIIGIMNAYLKGEKIQYFNKKLNCWLDILEPSFSEIYKYRIKA